MNYILLQEISCFFHVSFADIGYFWMLRVFSGYCEIFTGTGYNPTKFYWYWGLLGNIDVVMIEVPRTPYEL